MLRRIVFGSLAVVGLALAPSGGRTADRDDYRELLEDQREERRERYEEQRERFEDWLEDQRDRARDFRRGHRRHRGAYPPAFGLPLPPYGGRYYGPPVRPYRGLSPYRPPYGFAPGGPRGGFRLGGPR